MKNSVVILTSQLAFDVRVLKDHGTWVAQLVRDNKVEFSTTDVWAEELPEAGPSEPVVVIYAFSPLFWVFFGAGVYFGILIGLALK